MYNAAIKSISILCAALMPLIIASCDNRQKDEASSLYNSAMKLYDTEQYDSVLSVLDTLYKKYPAETDIIRDGIHLMAKAQEQISIKGIAQADSVISENAIIVNEIAEDFIVIKNPDLVENYRIYKNLKNNTLINRTGIEPRIDDNGGIYLVSLLHGKPVKHTKLRVTATDGDYAETSSVPFDNAQNYRFNNDGISNEMVTFHADECEEFCRFIADNANKKLKIDFVGNSSYSITAPTYLKEAIAQSFRYSSAIKAGLKAEKNKLYLTKRMEIAKRQIEQTKL